jgi:hypothetical protein
MLTERQKLQLKAAARPRMINGVENPDFGKPNYVLEDVIDQIKLENSHAFLEEDQFKDRVFFHQPKTLRDHEYIAYYEEKI